MSRDITDELATPLQRLEALPEMMAWRGEWTATDDYFRNNVVVDPTTTGSYVYTGFSASIRGGLPPSQVIGPSIWTAVGVNVASGVQVLREGDGIIVDGSDTIPTVNNNGVITLTAEGGLGDIGTAQFPNLILANSLLQVQAGLGISVVAGAVPTINNAGILKIYPGDGISVTGDSDLTLANDGVIAISAEPGTALTITAGQTPTVTNTGVISITPGVGILPVLGRPANEPQFINSGVVSIVPNNLQVTGGFPAPGDKELIMFNPIRTIVFSGPLTMVPATIPVNNSALVNVSQISGTLWESIMLSGLPYSAGIFMLNFGLKFTATLNGIPSINRPSLSLSLQDNTQNPPVELSIPNLPFANGGIIAVDDTERSFLFPNVSINVAQVRALGFRRLTGFRVAYGAGIPTPSILRLTTAGNCWATFFPQTAF